MHEIAYNRVSGLFWSRGPHHVAENFGNTFRHKFRQQLQKLDFFLEFSPKSAFSISHFGKEGGAPDQKFIFDVIPID